VRSFLFSKLSWRLDADSAACTLAPALSDAFFWRTSTCRQTSPWPPASLTATFRAFPDTFALELAK